MLMSKHAVRRLALLVCLSLIVGLLPIGMMSVPVEVNAVPSEAVNLLSNGDFENGTDGWVNAQLNANEGRTGNALQIDSKVKGKDVETAAASRTAVAAGAACEFSFYAKRDAADASGKKITAYVLWYDASGAYMTGKANYWNIGPGTDWELYQYSVTAPAGAAAAAVRFYGSSNFDGIVYVDDVAFAALNSSEPADTEPTQATEATEAASDNLMTNGDFETGLAGWPSSPVLSACTEDKHSGAASLKFTDNNGTAGGPYFQQVVPVKAGKTYKLSAWVKVLGGNTGYFGVYGIGSASKQLAFGEAEEWKQVEITVTVPSDKTEAKIEIGANSGSDVTYLIDDMVFAEVASSEPDPTVATEATVPTETTGPVEADGIFVDFVDGSAIPDVSVEQWKEYNGDEETVLTKESSMYKVGRGGNNKLVFQGGAKNVQYYAKSPVFAIEGGKSYTVKYQAAWYFSNAVNGTLELVFVDANGNALATQTADAFKATAAQGAWTDMLVSGNAPEAAVGAYLKFSYCVTGKSYDYWIRNLEVAEGIPEEEPTEPTQSTEPTQGPAAGALINGDFENGTANWAATGAMSACTDDKHRGSACMKFTDGNGSGAYYTTQKISVEPGKTYELSMWVKIESGKGGYFGVYGLGTGNNVAQSFTQASGWTLNTLTVTIPAGVTEAIIEIGSHSTTVVTFLIDDVLFAAPGTENPDAPSEPTAPTEPKDPNLMLEENFETLLDASDANSGPRGWISNDDAAGVYSVAIACAQKANFKYDGNYLLLQMTGSWYIQSAEFNVKPGYEYTADFMARKIVDNTDFNGYLSICFVDMFGIQLQAEKQTVGRTYGEWTAETVKAVAPEGAVSAYLIFGLDNTGRKVKADYAVDDLVITQSEQPVLELEEVPEVATEPVFEDNFQNYYTPEGSASSVKIPNGWTASQLGAAMSCTKYDDYDGTTNLCLQDNGDKWIRTPLFDAVPGNVYTAIFVEKKLNPAVVATGAYVKIAFVDKDENIIEESTKAIGAAARWSRNGLSAQAPAGAVKFYVEFGLKDVTGSSPSFCVDNLQVIKAEGTLSAPEDNTPEGGTTTPPEGEDNANTRDGAALITVSGILVAVVALAALVIKKRRFF